MSARRGEVDGQLADETGQRPEVLHQFPHRRIEQGEVEPLQPVQRRRAGGVPFAQQGGAEVEVGGDIRVGGRLDVKLDRTAGGHPERDPLVARLNRFHDPAVRGVDESLGLEARGGFVEAEVDDQLTAGAGLGPVGGDGAGRAEPDGAPWPTPRLPDLERFEPSGRRFDERDRLAGQGDGVQRQWRTFAVDGRGEPLGDEASRSRQDRRAVLMHPRFSFSTTIGSFSGPQTTTTHREHPANRRRAQPLSRSENAIP